MIGGFVPGDELTSAQSDRVYALRGGGWEDLPRLNHPRAAAAAAVVGDKIVVTGGQADGKLVPQTEVFDGESWKDVADIPTPREHLGAASDGRYLYAVGGRELSADKNLGTLERYDPGSDTWTKLKDMPTATGSVGAAFVGGRVITVGGESSTEASDAVRDTTSEAGVVGAAQAAQRPPRSGRDRPQGLALRHRRRLGGRAHPIDPRGRAARPRLRLLCREYGET